MNEKNPDYIQIILRNKNETYHHKSINKLLYLPSNIENEFNIINNHKNKNTDNMYFNSYFFTGGCDSVIKLWNYNNSLDEINLLCNLENHSDWVSSLLYIKNNNFLISASNDSSINVWDLKNILKFSNNQIYPKKQYDFFHNDYITNLKFNEFNNILYSSSLDGTIKEIDLNKDSIYKKHLIEHKNNSIYNFDINGSENLLAYSLYQNNEIVIFDLRSKKKICSLHEKNLVKNIKLSEDGKNILLSCENYLDYWDINKQKIIFDLDYHKGNINCFYVNNNFNKIISGSINGEIYINDLNVQKYSLLNNIEKPVLDIQFNDLENQILFSDSNGNLYIYDFNTIFKNKVNLNYHKENTNNKKVNQENKINKENIILDKIKLNPIIENNEYGKFCNIVKDEIEKFYLMKNKIYVIFKYKDSDVGYIYNLLTLKKIKNRKNITFNEIITKLQEIDKETLNSWCNIDIKTGCLNIILYNEKCFNNNIKNLNLNFVEEIIKREFSIISSNDLYLDMNNNNNDNDKNNKKMERTKKKIYVNNSNRKNIKDNFGNFIIKNLAIIILDENMNFILKNYFRTEIKNNDLYKYYYKSHIDELHNDENLIEYDDYFINFCVKERNIFFYLNSNNNKLILIPSFAFTYMGNEYKEIINNLTLKNYQIRIDIKIYFEVNESYNIHKKDYKDKNKNFYLHNTKSFKDTLYLLIQQYIDKDKLKAQIKKDYEKNIESFTENQKNFIEKEYLKNEKQNIFSISLKFKDYELNCYKLKDIDILRFFWLFNNREKNIIKIIINYLEIKVVLKDFEIE